MTASCGSGFPGFGPGCPSLERALGRSGVYGAVFDRDTERYVPQAGLEIVETRFLYKDIIKLIVARPTARPGG